MSQLTEVLGAILIIYLVIRGAVATYEDFQTKPEKEDSK